MLRSRKISLVAAVAALPLALAACGGSGGSGGSDDQTLTIWHYENEDSAMGQAWAKAIEIFEHTQALDLVVRDGVCVGVEAWRDGARLRLLARRGVTLANGGWPVSRDIRAGGGSIADGAACGWRALRSGGRARGSL